AEAARVRDAGARVARAVHARSRIAFPPTKQRRWVPAFAGTTRDLFAFRSALGLRVPSRPARMAGKTHRDVNRNVAPACPHPSPSRMREREKHDGFRLSPE